MILSISGKIQLIFVTYVEEGGNVLVSQSGKNVS